VIRSKQTLYSAKRSTEVKLAVSYHRSIKVAIPYYENSLLCW